MATMSFDYSKTNSGVTIERYRGSAEVVVVPSKIDGVPVMSIGFDAFGGHLNLKELCLTPTKPKNLSPPCPKVAKSSTRKIFLRRSSLEVL